MNHDNWYISLEYNYNNTQKTLKILEVLDYKKHKVLCGRNFYYLSNIFRGDAYMWNEIQTNKDIELLMFKYNKFHDSCLKELNYISGAYVNNDLSMNPINNKKELSIIYQRQYHILTNIQIVFGGLIRLNLIPSLPFYDGIIFGAYMNKVDDVIYWSNDPDFKLENINIPDYNNSYTWLCCKHVKWREI